MLSQETQDLLELVLQKIADEGYNVAGFYMSSNPPDFVDFAVPERSRSHMVEMCETWLSLLKDHSIRQEKIKPKSVIYQA